jgi:hypothetical protein
VNPEREKYLNLHTKPGKVTAEEASWHLGFLTHEIPMLMAAGLLPPLGEPPDNGVKFFSTKELDKLNQDMAWQAKACDAVVKYWKDRNLLRPTKNAQGRWAHKRLSGAIRPRQGSVTRPGSKSLLSLPNRKSKP